MSGRRWLNTILVLFLLVSGCSQRAPAATPAPASTPTPPPSPTPPPDTSATPVPPTGTAPPSATPAPSATAAPTVDPLHTACDHPYWPLRQGSVWHVKTQTRVYTETIMAVTGDLTQAQATLVDTYTNGTIETVLIECRQGGLAYGDANFTFADGHVSTKKVVGSSGQFLPAVADLTPLAKWSWSLTADYSVPNYDSKGVFTHQSQYRDVSSQDCTLTKTDAITLTVGTFHGLYVDCKGSDISNSNGTTATYPFNAQLVYALGAGPNGDSIQSFSVP